MRASCPKKGPAAQGVSSFSFPPSRGREIVAGKRKKGRDKTRVPREDRKLDHTKRHRGSLRLDVVTRSLQNHTNLELSRTINYDNDIARYINPPMRSLNLMSVEIRRLLYEKSQIVLPVADVLPTSARHARVSSYVSSFSFTAANSANTMVARQTTILILREGSIRLDQGTTKPRTTALSSSRAYIYIRYAW